MRRPASLKSSTPPARRIGDKVVSNLVMAATSCINVNESFFELVCEIRKANSSHDKGSKDCNKPKQQCSLS